MTEPVNHLESLRLLIEQYKRDPNLKGFIAAWLYESQVIEDLLWSIQGSRDVLTATGEQLRILGRLVGQDDVFSDDTLQRLLIIGRIFANASNGHPDDIIELLNTTLGVFGVTFSYEETYPAGFRVTLIAPPDITFASVLAAMVKDIKPAGVGANVAYVPPAAGLFYYNGGPGYGSSNTPSLGGEYARFI